MSDPQNCSTATSYNKKHKGDTISVGKLEFSYIDGEFVKWGSHWGNQIGGSPSD